MEFKTLNEVLAEAKLPNNAGILLKTNFAAAKICQILEKRNTSESIMKTVCRTMGNLAFLVEIERSYEITRSFIDELTNHDEMADEIFNELVSMLGPIH